MARLFDRSLQQLLDAIAASRPTPGCGAAASVAAATGLALVIKALEVSSGRSTDRRLQGLIADAHALMEPFDGYAAADGEAFRRLLDATPQSEEQAAASRQACAIPLATAHTCLQALGLALRAWPLIAAPVRSDLLAGAELLHAASRAALIAVDADLASLPSSAARDRVRTRQRRLASQARARLRRLARLARLARR